MSCNTGLQLEMADIAIPLKLFDLHEGEATRLLGLYDPKSPQRSAFPVPGPDQVLALQPI